jgi:hypothetical protein
MNLGSGYGGGGMFKYGITCLTFVRDSRDFSDRKEVSCLGGMDFILFFKVSGDNFSETRIKFDFSTLSGGLVGVGRSEVV